MKFATVTFGCRVNLADTHRVEGDLRTSGAEPASLERADLVIVNTCSVTAGADQGARQTIRRIARVNPSARIVVTGCYATRRPDEIAALPGVVRVVPNDRKDDLGMELAPEAGETTTAARFGDGGAACGAMLAPGVAGRTVFTLRVQTGCEERCSYCIIPSTRGRGRSLPPEPAAARAAQAAAAGFREVVLTGVHLGSYGRDLTPLADLAGLLWRLDAIDADVRFRVSSLEPMDCPPRLIDLVARAGRFAPHFHLPLQHASDRVLAAMRRPYGLDAYRGLVDGIRERLPDAAIGSDVIVGFPGETDDDFERLCSYLESSPLSSLHVFPYSDRPGTEASALSGKVPGALVRERGARVRAIGEMLAWRFRRSQIGRVRRGLTLEDGSTVLTDNSLKVRIPPGRCRNEWVDVRLSGAGAVLEGAVLTPELTLPDRRDGPAGPSL